MDIDDDKKTQTNSDGSNYVRCLMSIRLKTKLGVRVQSLEDVKTSEKSYWLYENASSDLIF